MTCVVGYVAPDRSVSIGADSAGVAGLDLRIRRDPKVFHAGPFLIGYTTSFRMGQLLRFALPMDELEDRAARVANAEDAGFRFMATHFVNAIRKVFKDGGFARKENEEESGGNFLVGFRGRLFEIFGDYQIALPTEPYSAAGCGADFALGAMAASNYDNLGALGIVNEALRVAEQFSAGVRGPFIVLSQLPPTADRRSADRMDLTQ